MCQQSCRGRGNASGLVACCTCESVLDEYAQEVDVAGYFGERTVCRTSLVVGPARRVERMLVVRVRERARKRMIVHVEGTHSSVTSRNKRGGAKLRSM